MSNSTARSITRQIRKTALAVLDNTDYTTEVDSEDNSIGDVIGAAAADLIENAFSIERAAGGNILLIHSLDALGHVSECVAYHVQEGMEGADDKTKMGMIDDICGTIRALLETIVMSPVGEAEENDAEDEDEDTDSLDADDEEDEDAGEESSDAQLMSEIDDEDAEAENILTAKPPSEQDAIN